MGHSGSKEKKKGNKNGNLVEVCENQQNTVLSKHVLQSPILSHIQDDLTLFCTPKASPHVKSKEQQQQQPGRPQCNATPTLQYQVHKNEDEDVGLKATPTPKNESLPNVANPPTIEYPEKEQLQWYIPMGAPKSNKNKPGRVHSATVSAVNPASKSVTVEWFEKGETKGKEIEFDAVFALNPDLAPQDQNAMPPPSKFVSIWTALWSRFLQHASKDNGEIRSNALQNKIGQTPARSTENISTSTVSKAASVPASRRRSNVVKEVDRIQKKREERRKQQAEKKEEKEALMNLDPGNPQWEFLNMIREFRSQLEFRTLKDGDPLEEHQITVAVRKRPLNKKENNRREIDVITIPKRNTLYVHEPRTKVDLTKYLENQNFRFDYAFDESCNNELVYKYTARPLVQTIFEGGMATCFAYGQTGSGKTHTMGGDFQGKSQDCAKGVYAMVAKDVFVYEKSPKYRSLNLQISASFFEIYGGKVFDLLNEKTKLRVLEDGKNVVQVVGLQERVCESVDDVLKLINLGSQVRTSGQTAANNQSSRSHAVFQIILRNREKGLKLHGKFSLIDLAGNERGADTSSANRQTRMEGAEINKSLLALKECIRALGRKGAHLPFRASKLTQVLRDSFIGDKSKTCMIAMISPGMNCCEHTLNTLRYADRVKELGISEDSRQDCKTPTEKEPNENGTGDPDYSRLSALNENEMSADQQAFQVAMSALQEAEEEVVDLHGQYFTHRDKMDKMLIPLYQMTNEVDYDVDAYTQQLEDVVLENLEWWTQLQKRVVKLRLQLEEEEKVSRRQQQ
ncbi:kinesin-like protein KIF2A [Palaemon carinicauda]|uniref:kinesin-like protein KIF2A n=1 Tax=Palaemon carinicauda TaxID=392227 RepID=UPI0035B6176E